MTPEEKSGSMVIEPLELWRAKNGSRPLVNYDAPDRTTRYASVVQASEDVLAEAVIEVATALKDKALAGNLGAIKELLNRIVGVPVQPMDIQTTHAQIDITDERREHILRIEQQLIEQTHGRRTINGISHSVGETEELTLSSSEEGSDTV